MSRSSSFVLCDGPNPDLRVVIISPTFRMMSDGKFLECLLNYVILLNTYSGLLYSGTCPILY